MALQWATRYEQRKAQQVVAYRPKGQLQDTRRYHFIMTYNLTAVVTAIVVLQQLPVKQTASNESGLNKASSTPYNHRYLVLHAIAMVHTIPSAIFQHDLATASSNLMHLSQPDAPKCRLLVPEREPAMSSSAVEERC